ncbi:hypothetical protein PR202_ga21863 [Eleusine coracana subsp. coracana]|uniref:Uncharacterized protein n=1 Tax=Eleusine coracana subsp. coracana TaxID=191504 RepID=A0AAV5D1P0_ELECO|nr:hypothetical protein PR202_ga21863 [Eleusine coracana subsp. coracana]
MSRSRHPSTGTRCSHSWLCINRCRVPYSIDLGLHSSTTTNIAAGRSSWNHPPIFHQTRSCLRFYTTTNRRRFQLQNRAKSRHRQTPVHEPHMEDPTSTGSPPVPEKSTSRMMERPRGLIPPRCRHHRFVGTIWNPNPRHPRT